MSVEKYCFINKERPCDLTCKAAFEVDDPVDNVDCYFIWLAHHFGEGLFSARSMIEGMGGGSFPPPSTPGSGPSVSGSGPTPKGPKGYPTN